MNGEDLIAKSYRSIALAWIIAVSWCIALCKPWIALSITVGAALGMAVLLTFDLVVRRAFVPGAARPGRALLKLALLKYPLIGIILYWLVRWNRFDPLAFCGGIVLVHFAVLVKAMGIRFVGNRESGAPPRAASTAPGGKEIQ